MKPYLTVLLIVLLHTHLTAQTRIAIKGSLGIAGIKDKYETGKQARITYSAGLLVNISLNDMLSVQPELLYSLKGYSVSATGFRSSGRMGYGYIAIPLLVGYKPTPRLLLLAGPEAGYMISANSHFDGSNHNVIDFVSNRFNIDAVAGVTWLLPKQWALELRGNFGLTPIYRGVITDDLGNETGNYRGGYHRVLQVGMQYSL